MKLQLKTYSASHIKTLSEELRRELFPNVPPPTLKQLKAAKLQKQLDSKKG